MADLVFGPNGPYSMVTTVVHGRSGACRLAELDLHLPSGNVRIRFSDRRSFERFCVAVDLLKHDANTAVFRRPVRTRVYTDAPPTDGEFPVPSSPRPRPIHESLALPS